MVKKLSETIAKGLNAAADIFYPKSYREGYWVGDNPFSFGKHSIASGIKEGYTVNTYVYSIVHRIATNASNITLKPKRRKKTGDREVEDLVEGDFYKLIKNPNADNTTKSFIYEAITFQLLTGNRFQAKETAVGFSGVEAVYNLFPQSIDIQLIETPYGYKPTGYKYLYNSKNYPYSIEEISHLKRFNPDNETVNKGFGLSPLQAAYKTLKTSNLIQTAEASTIDNRGMSGLLSHKGERPLTTDEKKSADEAVKKRIGGAGKFGSIGVTSGDFKLIQFGLSPADLKLLESGVFRMRDLAALYGVSSRILNDIGGSTYNNSKEDEKKLYINGVLPPLELEIEQFNKDVSSTFNDDQWEYYLEVDLESIEALREDETKKSALSRSKAKILNDTIKGISARDWTRESGIEQIMYSLNIEREQAEKLVGEEIELRINE